MITLDQSATNDRNIADSPEIRFAEYVLSNKNWASDGNTLYEWTEIYWSPINIEEGEKFAWHWLSLNVRTKATPRLGKP